jgi:hypothetical protein
MYQSELCRKEKRGRLVSWEVLFIGIGMSCFCFCFCFCFVERALLLAGAGTMVWLTTGCFEKGISFAYWLDFGMSYAGGAIAWRLPIAIQLIFAICVIILLFGLPESPR